MPIIAQRDYLKSNRGLMVEMPPDSVIFGVTGLMQEIRSEIEKLAGTDLPILIEGESGAGKDVFARWIHAHSPRQAGAFIKVHCPALPPMLLESDLFGYEQGVFAGALKLKVGQLEEARQGTLFLDGVSELDNELQAKFLRLLQDGRFTRIGGSEERRMSARFICSTRGSLAGQVESEGFRKDLFYRINAVHLHLPPLRMRVADIPSLSLYLLEAFGQKYGVPVRDLSAELMNLLQACTWPGNIRQLENVIRRYVVLGCDEESITAELLNETVPDPLSAVSSSGPVALKKLVRERVREQERRIILRTLHSHHWNRKETARALGISYQALLYKMRQDQLSQPRTDDAANQNLYASHPGADRTGYVN
ncbi:MAG: sigma 54-interacting transcriptional regulator [Terriglobia bacterium]